MEYTQINDFALIISLISLGFFGGFSHCMGMCGPFVLTQVSNNLAKTPLDKFSNFAKLKNLALLPYHAGRITTYSLLGFLCQLFRKNIQDFTKFHILSSIFLTIASLFFLNIFFEKKISNLIRKITFPFAQKLKALKKSGFFTFLKTDFFTKLISNLFKNPQGLNGYILGLILGFIPCGLLYGAFLITSTITNPILAISGMFLFGISTFPALFLTASGGYIFFKIEVSKFKIIAKIIALINAIMLLIMAIKSI